MTQSALLYFLRPRRESCAKHFKQLLLRQGGECAECGRTDALECDHIIPILVDPFGRNDPENLQLLCSECHLSKTVAQSWKDPFNPLLSDFNEHAWQEFVRSPRVPQLVTRYNQLDKRSAIYVADAVKCRRQLLAHLSPCVFSIWDEIRPVQHELMDFIFICIYFSCIVHYFCRCCCCCRCRCRCRC